MEQGMRNLFQQESPQETKKIMTFNVSWCEGTTGQTKPKNLIPKELVDDLCPRHHQEVQHHVLAQRIKRKHAATQGGRESPWEGEKPGKPRENEGNQDENATNSQQEKQGDVEHISIDLDHVLTTRRTPPTYSLSCLQKMNSPRLSLALPFSL